MDHLYTHTHVKREPAGGLDEQLRREIDEEVKKDDSGDDTIG